MNEELRMYLGRPLRLPTAVLHGVWWHNDVEEMRSPRCLPCALGWGEAHMMPRHGEGG